jgi:predicted amidohydrolase YtcJ
MSLNGSGSSGSTTLFTNGTIRTNHSHPSRATWLLMRGASVETVGSTEDPPRANRVVDLEGGCLVPAFCDAHVHLPATGLYAGGLDFRGATSADAILDAFARHARDGGAVMFGGNFEDPLDRPLNRRDLDRATGDRAAMLARADMHSCIVSSALVDSLELSGLEGVDRDDHGEPTGYLREQAACGAWNWFEQNLPRAEQIAAIRSAAEHCYSKGVAAVHEMFVVEWRGWDSYDLFTEAIEPLALDVTTYLGSGEVDKVAGLGHAQIGGDYFLDGSFGSHTAWLKKPFSSPPPEGTPAVGIGYRDDDELFRFFLDAQRAGLQVGVHAIGDAAIEQGIMTWERVAGEVGADEVRRLGHRIEHFECATDDHIARAAGLGLRASVQPAFDAYWGGAGGLYSQRIGWDRASAMNRFGTMNRAGLELGAGSDSTVTVLDPFVQMRALRRHHVPGESLDALQALWLHTRGSYSLAGPAEKADGLLEAGAVAHLAWLDRDPVMARPDELLSTEVLGTWIAGRRVWPHDDAESR